MHVGGLAAPGPLPSPFTPGRRSLATPMAIDKDPKVWALRCAAKVWEQGIAVFENGWRVAMEAAAVRDAVRGDDGGDMARVCRVARLRWRRAMQLLAVERYARPRWFEAMRGTGCWVVPAWSRNVAPSRALWFRTRGRVCWRPGDAAAPESARRHGEGVRG